ncbi:MAG: phosphatidylserine/phosphatidylglycerophosphate/cardiolipin synthase family protein [Desulfobacteraceae bacterium]|jgi:cardiolipin synthase|nr:phosphatidylserine/phosphatidylglycerophosphate/cardiolipin synthase family protein [Desulfobacteraceae bacterium]
MTVTKKISIFSGVLALLLMVALFFFVFNPLGLGPEPAAVLPPEFFANPAQDLSELELLVDGKEAFNEIFAAVDSAESSVYIQTYIWKDDSTGQAVAAKLKAAADRGVRVTVSKDMLGTFFELGDMLRGKPSPVFTRTGLKGRQNIAVNTDLSADTDHSKYYIFDERSVIFGGMNIADEYHRQWHDYMVLLRGKVWTEAFTNTVLKQVPWPRASALVLTVNNSKATEIRTATLEIIDNATESVVIEHAYFSDDKVIGAVKRAAARGVRVEVILPRIPDTHLYANLATINRLLDSESGKVPRILLYPHMSHAKVIMTDGRIVAIGSANLTPRSMLTSKEITLFVHGAPTAPFLRKLRAQLEADMAVSEEVVKPFELGPLEKVKAPVGKYVW